MGARTVGDVVVDAHGKWIRLGIPFPRACEGSHPYFYICSPVQQHLAVNRQSSTKSFMRFKVFSSVDLPQPEGPMKAVISFSGMLILMLFNA